MNIYLFKGIVFICQR